MTAPDRIYAKVHGRKMRFHVGGETGGYPPALVGGWEECPHTNAVEYIRADLATPAPEVAALVEAVERWADHDGEHGYDTVVRDVLRALAALRGIGGEG